MSVIDLYDHAGIGHDYKTGAKSSEEYINGKQAGVYALNLHLNNLPINKFVIHHYDQYKKKVDNSYLWVTEEVMEDALNWIVTLSSDAHEYLQKNGLYQQFGKNV